MRSSAGSDLFKRQDDDDDAAAAAAAVARAPKRRLGLDEGSEATASVQMMTRQAAHELVNDLEGRLAAQVTAQLAAFDAPQNERVDTLQQAVAKQAAAADDAALK